MLKLNLIGNRYGHLVAIRVSASSLSGKANWECLCDCGTRKIVSTSHLRSGHTTSCGKCGRQVDMLGKSFGRLTVTAITQERDPSGNVIWDCRCVCGKHLSVSGISLRNGNTQSCGCLHQEKFTNRTHGMSHNPLYDVWVSMLQRCYNPNNPKYSDYGGRGIYACQEWRDEFQPFGVWAEANGYERRYGKERLTLDRRDNEKGYSPENCRWVTYSVQNRNQRPRKRLLGA